MKIKTKYRKALTVVFIVGIVGVGVYLFLPKTLKTNPDKIAKIEVDKLFGWKFPVTKFPLTGSDRGGLAYSDIRDPGGIPQGLPVRLKIPIIGVDSAIEDALITPDGRMDVPFGSKNVAWFALGPHPGQQGSAVIGGHYGIKNGVPFVFYKLDNLKVGDNIYIVDDKNNTLVFVVRAIKLFNRDADATTVFASDDGLAHLNLITCEGLWNKINDSYPERRVIFTDAVVKESALLPDTSVFHRSLALGAEGADVVTLQTILIEKKFLTMPLGVAKGYFGRMTSAALARYQTSIGLQPVGVFGPLTRAKFAAELKENPAIPNTGEENLAVAKDAFSSDDIPLVTSRQTLIQSLKSLFDNPIDRAVTITLLLAIIFMAITIKKKG